MVLHDSTDGLTLSSCKVKVLSREGLCGFKTITQNSGNLLHTSTHDRAEQSRTELEIKYDLTVLRLWTDIEPQAPQCTSEKPCCKIARIICSDKEGLGCIQAHPHMSWLPVLPHSHSRWPDGHTVKNQFQCVCDSMPTACEWNGPDIIQTPAGGLALLECEITIRHFLGPFSNSLVEIFFSEDTLHYL